MSKHHSLLGILLSGELLALWRGQRDTVPLATVCLVVIELLVIYKQNPSNYCIVNQTDPKGHPELPDL